MRSRPTLGKSLSPCRFALLSAVPARAAGDVVRWQPGQVRAGAWMVAALSRTEQEAPASIQNDVDDQAAFFDVDGTVMDTNVFWPYFYIKMSELKPLEMVFWVPYILVQAIAYLIIDSFNRSLFIKVFYKNYDGWSVEKKEKMAKIAFSSYFQHRMFPEAEDCIRQLKASGWKIVLLTGSLDFLMAPIVQKLGADDILSVKLAEVNGTFTGELLTEPVAGEEKVRRMQSYASDNNLRLSCCRGYGDSISDLPMLRAVGSPHAVNPDPILKKIAESKGWPVLSWNHKNSKEH